MKMTMFSEQQNSSQLHCNSSILQTSKNETFINHSIVDLYVAFAISVCTLARKMTSFRQSENIIVL